MCTRRLCGVPSARASRASASSVLWPAAGKITSRTTPSGAPNGGFGDAEEDAGLAAHLDRLLHQVLEHAPLGLHRDAVRDADQQLDQAVHHLGLARGAPEGEQRQADAVRVPAQLPGGLAPGAAAEAPHQVGVQAAQSLQLADLGQQALQPDPAGIGGQPRESGARPVVGGAGGA